MEPVETTLKEINAVLGVTGSFVCASDGNLMAKAMPGLYETGQLALAARVANQFFQALEVSGQRATEMDLIFGQQRLILKTFRGGILAILCARTINLPLLNLTVNVATKKIAAAFRTPKPAALHVESSGPSRVAPAPATVPTSAAPP
ncbi:MAG: roadblock/LC7 domain-containing protein, partial [Acidobacteriota bacterium]